MKCQNICEDVFSNHNTMDVLRQLWEAWNLRILVLYLLIAQIYLHFFGRLRRKSASPLVNIVSVRLIYLFVDLLSMIAFGKLSKLKGNEIGPDILKSDYNPKKTLGPYALRVLWAPLVMFYLGGPDTLTVLSVEENKLWVKHFIGLLTQGLIIAYVLIATWDMSRFSLLALLLFVPGIIKYGERVWVVKSRSKDIYESSVQKDLSTVDKIRALQPNAELVLEAYSYLQTLMPHNPTYKCDTKTESILVEKFRESVRSPTVDESNRNPIVGAFKLIEIELGLIYDMLFSKVGTIFTLWGSILRFLSFSLIFSVLVIFVTYVTPGGQFAFDFLITIILLAGAMFLDIAGVFVQLVSDWAIVWACKCPSNWGTLVLFLHEFLISKRKRWSGVIGQFSYQDFCMKYKPTVCNNTREYLFGMQNMLKRFTSQSSPVQQLEHLIIKHLHKKSEKVADMYTMQTLTERAANVDKSTSLAVTRGECTLLRYDLVAQLEWSIDLEFDQSIVIWHVATQVLYDLDHPKIVEKNKEKMKVVKILSDYMMYLLVTCHDTFPFCDKYEKITKYYFDMKKLFREGFISSSPEGVERGGDANTITQVNAVQRLVQALEGNPKKWKIMSGMWVEMLCYAAQKCPVKNHIEELRHGGEFLTYIWLLLKHFGIARRMKRNRSMVTAGVNGGIESDVANRMSEVGEIMLTLNFNPC